MPIQRVELNDYEAYGNLVKQWARNPETRPCDLAEFTDQVTAANVGMVIPKRITKIRFVDQQEDTLLVAVPLPQMVEDSEAKILAGADYEVPDFYEDVAYHASLEIDPGKELTFHASRIGDYITSQCM